MRLVLGLKVSPQAMKPPLLMADAVASGGPRVDDATYARNALVAARDAARCAIFTLNTEQRK